MRRQRLTGPAIARHLGRPLSTIGVVLRRRGLGGLTALDPRPPVTRYERERPGELIHIDIKKLGRIDGIGHRIPAIAPAGAAGAAGAAVGRGLGAGQPAAAACRASAVRAHEDIVTAPESNQRWSSDALEICCWNGEMVRVVFAIDTCEREIIAWQASTGGISGKIVCDFMLVCVERRFSAIRVPHPVQWLTDNGSVYTAPDTLDFAALLCLMPCFTPVRRSESNGISETFIKILKRDYAHVQPRPDALTVLAQLRGWVDDNNEHHHTAACVCALPVSSSRGPSKPAPYPVLTGATPLESWEYHARRRYESFLLH